MQQFTTEYWRDTNSNVIFFPATTPPALPVTAVKIYVFRSGELLLTNIKTRGWDLPGGHIEDNETSEQAVTRELREETGTTVRRFELIGYLKITNEKENEWNTKYPKESCILVYKGYDATVDTKHNFELEASESKFVPIKELPRIHHAWNNAKAQVVEFALGCR